MIRLVTVFILLMFTNATANERQTRVAKAKAIVLTKKFYPYLNKDQITCVVKASVKHKVPHHVMATVLHKESSGGRNIKPRYEAHLKTSSVGMFQVLKSTGKWMGYNPNTLHEPCNNADASANYLRRNYNKSGKWSTSVRKYNGAGKRARKYLRDAQRFSKKKFGRKI